MNKQQLATRIWASANKMRNSKIEANEYKDFILGFIFYKYLSDQEEEYLYNSGWNNETIQEVDESDPEVVQYVQAEKGYFISYKNLFSTWLKQGSNFGVKDVTEALSAFNRLISPTHKKVFNNIFFTLQTILTKLGDTDASRSSAIGKLFQLIREIPTTGNQGYDVLGYIYEYLIGEFAANAGKKAGEFYTPHEVSQLMAEIVAYHLKDRKTIDIYDPTSGSGSLLITIGQSVAKYNDNPDAIKYYAQEMVPSTYNLTRMNLVMRGIKPHNIITRNGDTLQQGCDWPYFETEEDKEYTYEVRRMDAVVSNPPYSQEWDRPADKESDKRFKDFGLAPKKKADYAFLLHELYHLETNGIMTIVLPHGVLFRPGEEAEIRKNLIENGHIETIIGLPADIFFGTPIATIIMVLRKQRTDTDVLFIDASKYASKNGKKKKLQASDIRRVFEAVTSRPKEIEKFARLVDIKEIRANDYDLNIPKYVDSSEALEHWDLHSSLLGGVPQNEIVQLHRYWDVMPGLKTELFGNEEYTQCRVSDIKTTIENSHDIATFNAGFSTAFSDFGEYLRGRLMTDMSSVNTARELDALSNELYRRLDSLPLIDRYSSYQSLADCWETIASDLELIQSEGDKVIREVEPNMVMVKNGDEEYEVQKGWRGRIMPFDLVQTTFLPDSLARVSELKKQLLETVDEVSQLLEEAGEDDVEILNDEGDAFDNKKVKAQLKLLLSEYKKRKYSDLPDYPEGSVEAHIVKLAQNADAQKTIKVSIKKAEHDLEDKTIWTIESLTDEQISTLLHLKWIQPVVDAINEQREVVIENLTKATEYLAEKYALNAQSIDAQIAVCENELKEMLLLINATDNDKAAIQELNKLHQGGLLSLDNLFPKIGEQFPRLRFLGFDTPWESRPLRNYLSVSTEKNSMGKYSKDDVLSVAKEQGVVNQIQYQGKSLAGASLLGYDVINPHEIVYTKSPLRDQPYGIIKTNRGESGIVSSLYAVYKPLNSVVPEFVEHYFDSDDRLNAFLRPIVHKGAKNTLNVPDDGILDGVVLFPEKEEQAMIAQLCDLYNRIIRLYQIKVDKMRNLKSAMLDKLFV